MMNGATFRGGAASPGTMPVFSPGRDAVFTSTAKVVLQIEGFPDFYAILAVERDANPAQLETAIVSRGADLLAASFSRGGKSELLQLLERHMTEFRPVLLDKITRLAYDEQLRRHEAKEARAMPYEVWKQHHLGGNRLTRGLKTASLSFKARLKAAFWDAEYI